MMGDPDAGFLAGLPADQRASLERVNAPGLAALRSYLASGEAVAFLGAGASVPLYPLWAGLIGDLADAAAGRLSEEQVATCRALATSAPEEVVLAGLGNDQRHLQRGHRARLDALTRTGRDVARGTTFLTLAVPAPEPDPFLTWATLLSPFDGGPAPPARLARSPVHPGLLSAPR